MQETYDFIVVGAGLSGIDAGYRLKTQLPNSSWTILEARDRIGGTWSFFRFPGIRSDSQLTAFGFPWRPWLHKKDIADASLILEYIESAAKDEGIDKNIQFNSRFQAANWSSEEQLWSLQVTRDGVTRTIRTSFVINCSGYYNYEKPLQAIIPDIKNFKGRVAHPQFWPEDIEISGAKVVLIGSGATAVTMLPVLAKTAGHVTMLQRSPSYVFSIPSESSVGTFLKTYLPTWLSHPLNWWRGFLSEQLFVQFNLKFPNAARKLHMSLMKRQLPASVSLEKHFNPRYSPMEQRLCLCPDGDFFKALHRDNCTIVTDTIEKVLPDGILTSSGLKLDADIIVTATGLYVELLSGITPTVDGVPIDIPSSYVWRGIMLTGLPNIGCIIGYTTSSWTLGADAGTQLLIKLYKQMQKMGATSAVPEFDGNGVDESKPVVSHSSTYFVDARSRLPRITGTSPWYGRISPVYDIWKLWFGSLSKGMKFTVPSKKQD